MWNLIPRLQCRDSMCMWRLWYRSEMWLASWELISGGKCEYIKQQAPVKGMQMQVSYQQLHYFGSIRRAAFHAAETWLRQKPNDRYGNGIIGTRRKIRQKRGSLSWSLTCLLFRMRLFSIGWSIWIRRTSVRLEPFIHLRCIELYIC